MFNFLEDVKLTKEKEKKRKKIYGEELRLQIEENKKRKLEAKIKSRQESLRNLKLFQNVQINNYNYHTLNNYDDNNYNNFPFLKTSFENPLKNYKLNNNILSFSTKLNSFNNNYNNLLNNNNEIIKNLKNTYQKIDFNLNEKKNYSSKSFYSNNFSDNKKTNNLIENGIYIMKKSPSSFLNKPFLYNNYNNNHNNQYNFNNNDIKHDDYIYSHNENLYDYNKENIINNNNLEKNYLINSYNTNNNNLITEINMQILFREFVELQIKTINEYENNIEEIFFMNYKNEVKNDNNNSINIESLLEKEKNQAIQNIKNEQNKLKNMLGFFPLENNYNYKIEQLFNKILNKKVATYSSIKEMDNLALKIYVNRENEQTELLRYKSKYEDENLDNSIPNFQNFNKNSQYTLRGYSKLVKINEDNKDNNNDKNSNNSNDNDYNFLESWREQLNKDISLEKNENLELDNNLDKNENENNSKEKIKAFPANKFFKNAQYIGIKNKYIDKSDNSDRDKNLDLQNKNEINNNEKRNKSSNNIFYERNIISNEVNDYKKGASNPINNNKINLNLNKNNNNFVFKKNIQKNFKGNKGKNSFSFKKTDPSFILNAKKILYLSKSSNALKNYENFIAFSRDENKSEIKENKQINLEELEHSKITEKFKSSISSNSQKSQN